LAAVLIVVLAIWGFTTYRDQGAQKASQAYAQGMDALARGDTAGAYSKFDLAAASPSRAYRSLALMQQAGVRLDQRRTAEAVALFDKAAVDAPNLVIGDAARLKSALALLDTAPYGDIEARLKPLLDSRHPYKAAAREAMAMAELIAGRPAAARSDFVVVSLLADSTDDMRARARAAMALIDSGSAKGIQALIKAAAALPPTPAGAPQADTSTGSAPSDQTSQAGAAQ
jgi:hypothetical protein